MTTELMPASEATDRSLETMKRADLPAIWDGYKAQLDKLKATAETLTVTDASQKAEMKLARVTRLALKDVRVEIEHRRVELGEEALRRKQGIDAAAKELKAMIEPLESRLLEQEQFAERQEKEELAEEVRQRTAQLMPFWNPEALLPDLSKMTDRQFEVLFEDTKAASAAKISAVKKAEADRIAKEQADAAERKRIAEENARLKQEAAEMEAAAKSAREEAAEKARVEKEKADAEIARVKAEAEASRLAAEKKAAKERADADAKAKAEREKAVEAACVAAQEAQKEREAIEAKAKAEKAAAEAQARKDREAREKIEAELKAKKDAEEKQRKEEETARKKAERAPDKAKLMAFVEAIASLQSPNMATEDGKAALSELNDRITALCEWGQGKANEL